MPHKVKFFDRLSRIRPTYAFCSEKANNKNQHFSPAFVLLPVVLSADLEVFSHFSSDFIRCLFENSIRSDGKKKNKTQQIEKKEFLCLNCPRKYLLEVAGALNTLIVDIKNLGFRNCSITLIAFGKNNGIDID